jgi:hypothetical protein
MNGSRSIGKMAIGGALGVVLAITATQAWQATAAPGDTDATYVPVQPCRLVDMRPGTLPAAGKKTPLGAGVANVHTQQVTGNVGSCVGIPSDAVAVAMNVTITNPTAQSFLTVYPANQSLPNASNLNWVAGGAATPNKVDVRLSPDGKINMFNESGTVNVIADVVGYYTRSSLTELNGRLAAVESQLTTLGARQPVVEYVSAIDEPVLPLAAVDPVTLVVSPASEQLSVTINAPRAGKVAVVAHATAKGATGQARLVCQITNDPSATPNSTTPIDGGSQVLGIASPAINTAQPTLGTNRVFNVAAGPNTFDLMCAATGNADSPPDSTVTIHYRSMSATFTAG